MKRQEQIPEKIYVHESSTPELTEKLPYHIEYTRTDAFIEKACEYLQINLWRVVNEESDFRQRFVTDFRNYMKGE